MAQFDQSPQSGLNERGSYQLNNFRCNSHDGFTHFPDAFHFFSRDQENTIDHSVISSSYPILHPKELQVNFPQSKNFELGYQLSGELCMLCKVKVHQFTYIYIYLCSPIVYLSLINMLNVLGMFIEYKMGITLRPCLDPTLTFFTMSHGTFE